MKRAGWAGDEGKTGRRIRQQDLDPASLSSEVTLPRPHCEEAVERSSLKPAKSGSRPAFKASALPAQEAPHCIAPTSLPDLWSLM